MLVGLMWSTVLVAPAKAQTASMTLRSAVAGLAVAEENRLGYDRELFPHWVDEDRNGCHTRREVLIAEATSSPVVGRVLRPWGGDQGAGQAAAVPG